MKITNTFTYLLLDLCELHVGLLEKRKSRHLHLKMRTIIVEYLHFLQELHASHYRWDLRLLLGGLLWLLLLYWLLRRSITVEWWSELWLLLHWRPITVYWWSELWLLLYWRSVTVQWWSELLLGCSI